MDNPNSQKRSPRSSKRSRQDTSEMPKRHSPHRDVDDEDYMDRTFDHVARVRAAKEAAQRRMEAFGDVSEYDITIIHGQLKEESTTPSQPALDFPVEKKETD